MYIIIYDEYILYIINNMHLYGDKKNPPKAEACLIIWHVSPQHLE